MKLFRPQFEDPWEVVGSKTVSPLPLDLCFEDSELDQLLVAKHHLIRQYDQEVKPDVPLDSELQNAVIIAQQQLLEWIKKEGCHILVSESWGVTLLRRGELYRIKVEYRARPAYAKNAIPPPSQQEPPSLGVVQDLIHDVGLPTAKKVPTKMLHKRMNGYIVMRSLIKSKTSVSLWLRLRFRRI